MHDDSAGSDRNRRQWRFLARRPGHNWVHVYTSYKPTELDAVVDFGERQPQCFWQMEWQVQAVNPPSSGNSDK